MNRNILLLEPNYKNKFPPIGLMKLATYFRLRGDNVVFYKGDLKEFLINDITSDCVLKLSEIDNTINWKLRSDRIATYIKTRRTQHLDEIKLSESSSEPLLTPWVNFYKDYYHKKKYLSNPKWDWVCVTTLFTFYWDITIETINFAKGLVKDPQHLMVGGVLASIQPKEIEEATGIKPHCGVLLKEGIDEDNEYIIDELPLDYSILDEIDYEYVDSGAFFSYTTRGCIRKCPFCAVPTLEPYFRSYIPLKERIDRTKRLYGDQQNLLLMDNNVLASDDLKKIITDIRSCGFIPGARYIEPNQYKLAIRNLRLRINDRAYIRKCWRLLKDLNEWKSLGSETRTEIFNVRKENGLLHHLTCTKEALISTYTYFAQFFDKKYAKQRGRLRYIDFNQGVDARLFNEERVSLLAQIPVRPLRIAFDDIKTEEAYIKAIKLSHAHGIKDFSNYLLYNFRDYPQDLYYRMRVNVMLCEELDVNIYSFPMKYHPIRDEHSHDRDYIGEHWNRKYIRAVQAILNATKGKIGRGVSFFEKAFGRNTEEFMELLIMPETFLLFRFFFEHLGYTDQWRQAMASLTDTEREEALGIIHKNNFSNIDELSSNENVRYVLSFYKNYRGDIVNTNSELYKKKVEFDVMQKSRITK